MLSLEQRAKDRADFLDVLHSTCPELPAALYSFLDQSDFFSAPASTKYHGAYEGGLLRHSLDVYTNLAHMNYQYLLGYPDSTVAKVGLFHDLCKVNFYVRGFRNVRLEDGRWVRREVWDIEDQLPLGHGEKSLAVLLAHGVVLTEEEMLAIRWHMGGFDDAARSYAGGLSLSNAMDSSALVTALQIADLVSTRLKKGVREGAR